MLATPWRKLMIEIRFTYERVVVRSSTSEAATWSPSWLPLQTWQLNHCTLGYRTPRDDDSDESVCSLPCGPYQIHPTGKQVCLTDPDQTHSPLTHKHAHTFKHTLPEASTVCHTINTNWPFFMVTNIFHMFRDYVETAWPQQKRAAPCSWERKAADCSGQDIY